jgi:uncharacterized protein YkwD
MSAAARFRYTLVAGSTAVVIGAGFTMVGLSRQADAGTTAATLAADSRAGGADGAGKPGAADPGVLGQAQPGRSSAVPTSPAVSPAPSASASPSVSPSKAKPSRTARTHRSRPTAEPSSTSASPRPPATEAPPSSGSVIDQVLAHINAARTAEGLSKLTLSGDLSKASALHNGLMIDGCGLSHQCSGESGLGDRFSAQGVKWSSAGENIGYGSSGASDADLIKAANGLTDSMLAEKPPNDGHRKNLLNPDFKRIGLSVVRDAKGITWMTQDFVN